MTEHTDTTIRNAAAAVRDLVADLHGNENSGTLGQTVRNTLRAITRTAESFGALADDLRGHQGSFSKTTGTELRAALKRIGVRS